VRVSTTAEDIIAQLVHLCKMCPDSDLADNDRPNIELYCSAAYSVSFETREPGIRLYAEFSKVPALFPAKACVRRIDATSGQVGHYAEGRPTCNWTRCFGDSFRKSLNVMTYSGSVVRVYGTGRLRNVSICKQCAPCPGTDLLGVVNPEMNVSEGS